MGYFSVNLITCWFSVLLKKDFIRIESGTAKIA